MGWRVHDLFVYISSCWDEHIKLGWKARQIIFYCCIHNEDIFLKYMYYVIHAQSV